MMAAFGQLQQENVDLRNSVVQLQNQIAQRPAQAPTTLEPKLTPATKFSGSQNEFRGFISIMKNALALQPNQYPTDQAKVGFVSNFLTGTALKWFSPLVETNSPLLSDYPAFLTEMELTFGNLDQARTTANKIKNLKQGNKPASVYASEFQQLSSDLNSWGEAALISQFQDGLNDEVNDLLLTLPDPATLAEAMHQAIRCDNRLFQKKQKHCHRQAHGPALVSPAPQVSLEDPMQIDSVKYRKLSKNEKIRRQQANLCLYCGQPGHFAKSCPNKKSSFKLMQSSNTQPSQDLLGNSNVQLQ